MIAEVYSLLDSWLGYVRAEPRCGEDFCDRCGDCLVCYNDPDSPCLLDATGRGQHRWVVYDDDEQPWLRS